MPKTDALRVFAVAVPLDTHWAGDAVRHRRTAFYVLQDGSR